MKLSRTLWIALLVALPAAAADVEPPKYAPGIVGRLTRDGRPLMGNVCLRSGGSEIRQCAYSDFDGHFYLPTLGAVQPKRPDTDDDENLPVVYPPQWLELTPRGEPPTRLYPIDLVNVRTVKITLDCDVTRREITEATARPAADLCRLAPDLPVASARPRH